MAEIGTLRVKTGLAEMLKGGVIMDVVDAEQARIAEDAGACAVMALERVPADIRRDGGVARMSDPEMIREIQEAVSIPVMAKCRIGHFVEAQILEALEIDYIDESEVLTPADVEHHVDKHAFTVPFVCGATNLGEALRRIAEGAAMIRTKGEAGHGRHRQRGHAHAVGLRRDPRAAGSARGGALRRREGAPRTVRARPLGRGERAPAGRHLHRRRDRDARRRGALHAARSGRRLRRLGDLQVGRPRSRARRRSSRRRRTTPTRRSSPTSPRGSASRWSASPRARSPRPSGSKCAAGSARATRIYTWSRWTAATDRRARPPGRVPRARARPSGAGADAVEVRLPEQLDGLDGLVIPGGESTTIARLARLYGLDDAIRAFRRPIFGTCAGMILLDRRHLGLADVEVERNAYGRQVASFEADLELAGRERPVPRRLHPRAARPRGRRRASRCSPSSTASPCCCATATCSSRRSTPS